MRDYKNYFIAALGILLIATIFYTLFSGGNVSGRAVLDLNSNYENGIMEGTLSLSLKEGELIPEDSKIVFESASGKNEYLIKNIINKNTSSGNFYSGNSGLSGSGKGYGFEGEKTVYPEVSFSLNILSENENVKKTTETPSGKNQDSKTENKGQEISETNSGENNESGNESDESNPENESITTENNETFDVSEEQVSPNETIIQDDNSSQDTNEVEFQPENGNSSADSSSDENNEETLKAENSEQTNNAEQNQETTEEQDSNISITGGVISNLFRGISNLFFTITGQATFEVKNTVNGKVSANNDFTYNLNPGENAELVSGSVKSGSKSLSDNVVNVEVNNNKVIVTTDYFESEKGFGKDYVTDNPRLIKINLSELDLNLSKGDINLTLKYNGTKIINLKTILDEGNVSASSLNETVPAVNFSISESNVSLTDSERTILRDRFNNASVKTTKAELVNDRIVIRYELGDYWSEFSYDKELTEIELDSQSEKDRINWLKNLAGKFSGINENGKSIDSLVKDYEI